VEVIKSNLDAFYKFMFERHSIWHRRFRLKQPPPWTKDPALRDLKFTNIYRELDRGTIYYLEEIVPIAKNNKKNLLWLTVMYRLLNKVETFQTVGTIDYAKWNMTTRNQWRRSLEKLHETGPIFTSAHLTLPVRHEGQEKLERYFEVLDVAHSLIPELIDEIKNCKSLESVFDALRKIPCVGSFISYEICCDLILTKMIPFSENDWSNCGPGAKGGIKLIYPLAAKRGEYLESMRKLANEQGAHFKRLGLDFPYLYKDTPLTLRSIEHSLCEWRKYMSVLAGVGKHRQIFRPQSGEDPRGAQLRFPREDE
jgi:hypothetical protein